MARITNVSIKQEPEHYTLTIRKTIDFMNEYSDAMEQALSEVEKYMGELGVFPMNGPITCFHNVDLEALDVEMGFQVVQPAPNRQSIVCNRVPARKVASAIDLGPYEGQDPTMEDVIAWIDASEHERQGPIYHCCLNDPDRPPETYLTEIYLPLK